MNATVRTKQGDVRGRVESGIRVFRGIPFAAPPFGPGRFQPPRPAEPWSGVRDALAWGSEVPQLRPDPGTQALVPDPAAPGEDCLNLNVWTPALGSAGLPVMVWIHGGMFEAGTAASYDGSRFARDGIVCVAINYRVGADGFLLLGDGVANVGLLDQVAALEWVQDNVAAFGGDPGNVTIFGESAGAMSAGTLLSMPRAEGLFRRAILQSGAAHHVQTAASARRMGARLAERIGVESTHEALAAVPVQRFLVAQAELKGEILAHPDPDVWGADIVASLLPWQPAVDGHVVPARPIDRIAAGAGADVDVVVGTNADDWRLFIALSGALDAATDDSLAGPVAIHGHRALAAYGLEARSALAAYRSAHPGETAGDILARVATDWWCRMPALRLAEARVAAPSPTYMYEFAWPSPAFDGRLGACHALEIPFVFDTLDTGAGQIAGPLLGPAPPQGLADSMHRAWVAFAATGDPGWPRYEASRRATWRAGGVSEVVIDPRRFERELWAGVR